MFRDANGKLSMTRILSLITCLTGLALAIIGGITGQSNSIVILGLVTIGFAGKVTGAKFENGGLSFETQGNEPISVQQGGQSTFVENKPQENVSNPTSANETYNKIGFGK